MTKITKEDIPAILTALVLIVISLVGDIWAEYRLPNKQFGFVFALCVFLLALYVAIFRNRGHRDQGKIGALAGLGITLFFFVSYTVFSVAIGFCGDVSWLDFLLFKVWRPAFCSSVLATAYGLAASVVPLALWGGIAWLCRLIRQLGNDGNK